MVLVTAVPRHYLSAMPNTVSTAQAATPQAPSTPPEFLRMELVLAFKPFPQLQFEETVITFRLPWFSPTNLNVDSTVHARAEMRKSWFDTNHYYKRT